MFLHVQNAWKMERPEEFVKLIVLAIPTDTDVENPIEDAAFMAWIGAKQRPIGDARRIVANVGNFGKLGLEYEVANVATGRLFAFVRVDYTGAYQWAILRRQ